MTAKKIVAATGWAASVIAARSADRWRPMVNHCIITVRPRRGANDLDAGLGDVAAVERQHRDEVEQRR